MKKIEIMDLYDIEYSVKVINALQQRRTNFSCIGAPKRCNMLLFLDGCSAVYTQKDGQSIYAQSDDMVYIPLEAEYTVEFFDFQSKDSQTVHINFWLFDAKETPFVLNENITVFRADNSGYRSIFYKIDHYSEANIQCRGKIKSIMYDLLFKLSDFYRNDRRNKYNIIANGITYLEQDEAQILSIGQIASTCNVSEVYFRKIFKEYSGLSPAQYRLETKICRAKNYLKQDDFSLSEIAERLGFAETSYFIRVFKKHTGITPGAYRTKQKFLF